MIADLTFIIRGVLFALHQARGRTSGLAPGGRTGGVASRATVTRRGLLGLLAAAPVALPAMAKEMASPVAKAAERGVAHSGVGRFYRRRYRANELIRVQQVPWDTPLSDLIRRSRLADDIGVVIQPSGGLTAPQNTRQDVAGENGIHEERGFVPVLSSESHGDTIGGCDRINRLDLGQASHLGLVDRSRRLLKLGGPCGDIGFVEIAGHQQIPSSGGVVTADDSRVGGGALPAASGSEGGAA